MQYVLKSKYFEKRDRKKIFQVIIFSLLIVLLAAISFSGGMYFSAKDRALANLADDGAVYAGKVLGQYSDNNDGRLSEDLKFDLFWNVWDSLRESYVDQDKLNDKKMFYGAIQGMVASVGDPYTIFMDPELSAEFQNDLSGTFEGIGAEIGMRESILTIIAPLEDMPAEQAGLKSGDQIYMINAENTMGMSVDQAVSKIRGPKDTQVTLSIVRKGLDAPMDITITRGIIVVKSVRTEMRDDKLFVLRISNFNDDTEGLFNKAVDEIVRLQPKGIILDLRNDPGGYLDTAIEVSSEWIEDGPIVIEEISDGSKVEYPARGAARLTNFPTIVLVNGGSASASEIVAGALRDYNKAQIIGEKSFGKGSVQSLSSLDDGSLLKVTIAKWLTPLGSSINDEGITPDIEIELTTEDWSTDKDPQFDKAVEILKSK